MDRLLYLELSIHEIILSHIKMRRFEWGYPIKYGKVIVSSSISTINPILYSYCNIQLFHQKKQALIAIHCIPER